MITKMMIGIVVQSTSIKVLCVVLEGVGFRFSENRHMT